MPLPVSIIPPSDAITQWNNFALSQTSLLPFSYNPSLFFFYQKHFNWKPFYFLLTKNNSIEGLFPLINTEKAWVSLPHFSYGGLFCKNEELNNNHLKIATSLIESITKNNLSAGFYYADVENLPKEEVESRLKIFIRALYEQPDGIFSKSEKITSLFFMPENVETVFSMLKTNLRRKIRKGDKSGLEIKQGGAELLNDFYYVYTKNIYHLKSLNYSKQFFDDLFATFNYGVIRFFVAYRNEKPVGSAVLVSYGDFYENIYFATLLQERKNYVADWLHWQMIQYVVENKEEYVKDSKINKVYSFGRSTNYSSVHKFKSHWPVTDVPLYTYSDIPDFRNNSLIQKVWGLLPYFISRPFGSKLVKHIY